MNPFERSYRKALSSLAGAFQNLPWDFRPVERDGRTELVSQWLGRPAEDIMVCAFRGKHIDEPFHRQDFFFFNFAMANDFSVLNNSPDNRISIHEGDCYLGQPYSGYALRGDSEQDIAILGVLIRRETFLREYLGSISSTPELFRFFLEPSRNSRSDGFIHFHLADDSPVWPLVKQMAVEYAGDADGCQGILKPLTLVLTLLLAREFQGRRTEEIPTLSGRILAYMDTHPETVTLKEVAAHFGYHPNYISALLPRETGRRFGEILKEKRLERGRLLLENTLMTVEDIARMLGYDSTTNFYKAFRARFGIPPRGYANLHSRKERRR